MSLDIDLHIHSFPNELIPMCPILSYPLVRSSLSTQHAMRQHLAVGLPRRPPAGQQHPAEPRMARAEPLPSLPVQRGQEADHDALVSPGRRGRAPPPTHGAHGGHHARPDRAQYIRLPGQDLPRPHQNQAGGAFVCFMCSAMCAQKRALCTRS